MPRFVILEHDWPQRHWDLLLESGTVLKAWRLACPPTAGLPIAAEASFDHRLLYLDFVGEVPGNRGTVSQWDSGHYEWIAESAEGLMADLGGKRFCGRIRLKPVRDSQWEIEFIHNLDDAASIPKSFG